MDDEDAQRVAEMDQIGAEVCSWAPVAGQYFDALLVNGFERHEALTLTRDFLRDYLFRVSANHAIEASLRHLEELE